MLYCVKLVMMEKKSDQFNLYLTCMYLGPMFIKWSVCIQDRKGLLEIHMKSLGLCLSSGRCAICGSQFVACQACMLSIILSYPRSFEQERERERESACSPHFWLSWIIPNTNHGKTKSFWRPGVLLNYGRVLVNLLLRMR